MSLYDIPNNNILFLEIKELIGFEPGIPCFVTTIKESFLHNVVVFSLEIGVDFCLWTTDL